MYDMLAVSNGYNLNTHKHTHTVFSAGVTSCWMIWLISGMSWMEHHAVRLWCVWIGSVSLFSTWTWAPAPPDPTDMAVPVTGWDKPDSTHWIHVILRFTRLFCMSIHFSLYYYDKYFLAILNLNRCAIMRRHVHVTQRGRGQIAVCLILQKYHPLLKMRDPRVCGFALTLIHSYKHIQIEWSLFIKHQKRFQFKSWWNLLIFWMYFCEWVTHTFIIYTLHEWGSDVQKFGVVGFLYF